MVVRISDKTQNYSKVTKLLVKPKFYRLSKEDYEEFTDTIRVNKEYWIDCCSEYNDGISEW